MRVPLRATQDLPPVDIDSLVDKVFPLLKFVSSTPGPRSVETILRLALQDLPPSTRELSLAQFAKLVGAHRAKVRVATPRPHSLSGRLAA